MYISSVWGFNPSYTYTCENFIHFSSSMNETIQMSKVLQDQTFM